MTSSRGDTPWAPDLSQFAFSMACHLPNTMTAFVARQSWAALVQHMQGSSSTGRRVQSVAGAWESTYHPVSGMSWKWCT